MGRGTPGVEAGGEADPRRGQAVLLQDALDGPLAEERTDAQGFQLGADGSSPGQAVAGGRRGMGLEPAAVCSNSTPKGSVT